MAARGPRFWPAVARVALLAALPLGALALASQPPTRSEAQRPPATYYGLASAGDLIEARSGGVSCQQATAAADGFWMMTIVPGAPCAEGASIRFARNGLETTATETLRAGGAPSDRALGVVLPGALPGVAVTPAAGVKPPEANAAFAGELPSSGSAGLLVTRAEVHRDDVLAELASAGCVAQSIAVVTEGKWRVYIAGAPGVVNAAFPSTLGATSAFAVRC